MLKAGVYIEAASGHVEENRQHSRTQASYPPTREVGRRRIRGTAVVGGGGAGAGRAFCRGRLLGHEARAVL